MNYKMMCRVLSQILLVEGIFMIPALMISLSFGETKASLGFAVTIAVIFLVCGIMWYFFKAVKSAFFAKEGLAFVGLSWIVMSLVGCMPFIISGSIPNFIDAFFEIVSGFTTTGASILTEVESLPKGILYWRSFSHWLGGMGVLVFLLAISPAAEKGSGFSMHLMRAESPGPNVGKLAPKIRETAMILYLIYIGLTFLDVIFLLIGRMPLFDAVCTALGTAGTGGFGIKNDSMASYSPYLQNVCTIFMLLFGVNFSCYYLLLLGKLKSVWKDEELRTYVGVVIAAIVVITWNLKGFYATFSETVRHAAFQVATVVTTTGFATTDFDLWPAFSKTILMMLMIMGACAGSTGGGMKVGRLIILLKSLKRNIIKTLHPRKVLLVKNNGEAVGENVVENVNAFLAAYVIIIMFSLLLVSLDEYSFTTNFSAVIACFNNIGPGFDMVGATGNYSAFSVFSKLVLSLDMLAGRLEIFPILILFSSETWKRR